MLSIKAIVLVVHITLVKPNVMWKLNGMNIIVQPKFQDHQNTFETISATILHELSFQILPKNAKTSKNLEASYIALWKPDLNKQKDFERSILFKNGVR